MATTTVDAKNAPLAVGLRDVLRRVREGMDLECLGASADVRPGSPREAIERDHLLAEIRYELGQYSESRKHCLLALRRTRCAPELRPEVRCTLSKVLIRMADLRRAERLIRRGLVEFHLLRHPDMRLKAYFLSNLGLIHRRAGFLTSAAQLQLRALHLQTLAGQTPLEAMLPRVNLALALAHRGDFRRAESVLSQAERDCHGPGASTSQATSGALCRIELVRAFVAMEEGRWTDSERALSMASGSPWLEITRCRWLARQYAADLEIGRGRPAAAIPGLRALLEEVRESDPSSDAQAGVALSLAAALHGAGLFDEGLENALLAARLACRTDRWEWAGGLRVAGLCLAALGRRNEAHHSFAEAMVVLESTEFVTERKRLLEAISKCGLAIDDGGVDASASTVDSSVRDRRLATLRLRDERTFLTSDRTLVTAIERAAGDRLPVFLVGETGTGKELVAHLIHEGATHRNGPFVVVDCTTLHEGLVESELFGASRGAYTGAVVSRSGLVAAADGGTLFLDEISELPLALQSKLLRLLQDGTYRRVGEERVRRIQARVIAATNRDPYELMRVGALKSDLFYRLDGHQLVLAPLRDQADAFDAIANALAKSVGLAGVSQLALARLRERPWRGNFRQLEMFMRRAATGSRSGDWIEEAEGMEVGELEALRRDPAMSDLRQTRREAERERLRRAIEAHQGNRSAAARALAISRQGLYKALRRTGLA